MASPLKMMGDLRTDKSILLWVSDVVLHEAASRSKDTKSPPTTIEKLRRMQSIVFILRSL